MPKRPLTLAQQDVLDLLSAYYYRSTRQVWEQARTRRSKRATEQLLARLRQAGLVAGCPRHHTQGRASPWVWWLLPAGAAVLGHPYHPPPPLPPTVTTPQRAVLQLLAEMKQLTTTQIRRYLHPDKDPTYTRHVLARLRARGLVASAALDPRRGWGAEHYWMLRPAGCAAVHRPYSTHYTRRPHQSSLLQREAHLTIQRQVAADGWKLLAPVVYNTVHPRPEETPQARHLVTAVLAVEHETLLPLLAHSTPPQQLEDRWQRWRGGHVGAVVPRFVNDYVAYQPDQPQHTAVFILQPLQAGTHYWTRPLDPAKNQSCGRPQSRLERYRRLAVVLPVIVLFLSKEAAVHSARLLAPASLRWSTVEDLAANWVELLKPPPRR
jgi:hypothetical protein